MLRVAALLLGVCLTSSFWGCGGSCDSVQEEIETLGRSIQKNPQRAMEASKELQELKEKLQEMGCLR